MTIDHAIQSVASQIGDAVIITAADPVRGGPGAIAWVNPAFEAQTGLRGRDVVGRPFADLYEPDAAQTSWAPGRSAGALDGGGLAATARNGEAPLGFMSSADPAMAEPSMADPPAPRQTPPLRFERQARRRDGAPFWAAVTLSALVDPSGRPTEWVAVQRDVDALRLREMAAAQTTMEHERLARDLAATRDAAETAQRRLWSAIEAIPDAFVLFDREGRLVAHNAQYRKIYALSEDAIETGATFEDILRRGLARGQFPEAIGREEAWLTERLRRHRTPDGSFEQELPGDRYVRVDERATADGDIVGFRVDMTEIRRQQRRLEEYASALEAANARIRRLALQDELTDLPNRRALDEHLAAVAARCQVEGIGVAVLQIDLDRFKLINDMMGHQTGDHLLRHAADVLRRETTENDFVARVGGDEFVIVSLYALDYEHARDSAAAIVRDLARPVFFNGRTCRFGASVGLAAARGAEAVPYELLAKADIALSRAKALGRHRVEEYSRSMQQEIVHAKMLADGILQALEQNEFFVALQPQFDAETWDLAGLEALVRWRHPTRGVLTPDAFLAVAEELDVLAEIDGLVLEHALADCSYLRRAGVHVPKVSVNVALNRLQDANLLNAVDSLYPFETPLAFELLESIFLDDYEEASTWNIEGLKQRGVTIEIDDFGTGHASIIGLMKIGPHRVKIDRQLVAPLLDSDQHRRLISATVEIAKALGIKVTAEGVETFEQARLLRDLGCDTLQGFAFCGPLPVDELTRFLLAESWRASA